MRRYHRKTERKDDIRNVDYIRLKKGITKNEADIDELIKYSSLELFLDEIYVDWQKPFVQEFGVKGFKITFHVYDLIIENLSDR